MSAPERKVATVRLNRLFGEKFVNGVIDQAKLPEDMSEHTILISGCEARYVSQGAAHELLRLLDLREPRDIISTQLSEAARTAFMHASFNLGLASDYVYIPYEELPGFLLRSVAVENT